jgi:hypothetical protein
MKYWYDKEFGGIICEPNCADEWMRYIWEVGLGYDGCHTVESLKGLVDELIEFSINARKCLSEDKIFEDKNESKRSLLAAREEMNKYA